ncbi:MAG: peptide chain release factor N(5)-glutamine methyltransferase [Gammaproteobacteria bacterium]|nr:peptide chain release factor N(5)-glutamine methyltransferase [Gammaproteobacteria bacterium]
MILRRHLDLARQALAHNTAGALEAEILLAHALESPRSFLYAHPDMVLPPERAERFHKYVERRSNGEPIAYITGSREFWSLELHITPDVLIPRHETESLVEAALQIVPVDACWRLADLGTGSGAVALALARERPECEIHATDISPAATELASCNAKRHSLMNVSIQCGSWCAPLNGRFSLIVSNPPYVAADDPHLDTGDCRFEPGLALTPGKDPMKSIGEICSQAPGRLEPNGCLILEHGASQGEAVREILAGHGFVHIETRKDLSGRERISQGQWPGELNEST